MESLSRHRHGGRKHSSARDAAASPSPSFSFKGPYDDVSLSTGGKSKFGVYEYAEIFSGSSSIPVLDLSSLDERVGSGEFRSSSRLDYSNIFGGLRNDEVVVPYEELLAGGAAKKIETQIPVEAHSPCSRIPEESHSPCQESGPPHSPGKNKKSSGEAADESSDGIKQQFNMSFNKIIQRESDKSNGKTHIAQLHAVPGFTCFVDGTPQLQKKESDGPVSLLKHEVSRTWSFNVSAVNELASEKSHIPDKPGDLNEINLKTHGAEVPPSLSHPCNPFGESDPRGSRLPSFDSREASVRTGGEYSLPLLDEELDENSVAAMSAAALKKAVEQAQESIRIARMIMERKKENLQGGSKPRLRGPLKIKDKNGTRIGNEVDDSIKNNAWEKCESIDTFPIFTGISGEFAPSLSYTRKILKNGKAEVGRVSVEVEEAKENEDVSSELGKRSAESCSQSGTVYSADKVALENTETAEACQETNNIIGLAANGECRIEGLVSGKVGNHNKFMCFTGKLQSHLQEMESVTGNLKQVTIPQLKGVEDIAALEDKATGASRSVEKIAKSADDIPQSSERVIDSSQNMQFQEKIEDKTGEDLGIMQVEEVMDERDDVADCKVKYGMKFLEHKETVFREHLTVHKSVFNNLLNGFRSLTEEDMLGLEDMENTSETYPERQGSGQHGKRSDEEESKVMYKEAHLQFERERQLTDSLEEEISESESEIFSEVRGHETSVNLDLEPEMNGKEWNYDHDGDGCISTREYEQNGTVERQMDISKFEVAKTIGVEANNCAEVVWDAEETIKIHRAAGERQENEDKFNFQVTASGKDGGEAVDACDNDFGITSRNVDSNDKAEEEYQAAVKGCRENVTSSPENKEAGKLFHPEVNEMPGKESLRRFASEEKFIGSKLSDAFEGFSSDSSTENADLVYADHQEKLARPEDVLKAASEIHNVAQEEAAELVVQEFPDFCPNSKTIEFDQTDVKSDLEQASGSMKRTVSTSILEDMNEASSADESLTFAENAEDDTTKKGEIKHGHDITSDARDFVEPEEIKKSMRTKREVETSKNMEKDKESLGGPSTMKQKDARGTWQELEANDRQQRIEAIKKGREREKDRRAVERAIREARERAFAEAREKAERAAVERAAAEAQRRVKTETQEKLEKASMESRQSTDDLSTEAKIRARRTAVERATTEARERALEKAMPQKTYTEARIQAERYSTERLSGSTRGKGLKHSFSSSDLENFDETTSESAERRKARLERHHRIMERAAKALAEKNKRDLLAQKEQAEKNRLAETLDAEIKRWASGKEGNLRALLSTLQYILVPDSGWQPTSLTEIITTAAVKKAYRKATLCVHPDKLQQRGATIQQKYICEKVFDLLKAAWNRFNSEEN